MLFEVKDLQISFATPDGDVEAVRGLDFEVDRGEALGIVGGSGSGKSQSVLSLMGLLAPNARVSGSARLAAAKAGAAPLELLGAPTSLLRRVRGARIAMVFQDPMTALNPHLKISTQMIETLRTHRKLSRRAARAAAIEMLEAVRIPEAARRIKYYPHQFSGGMRQRVMIAMALSCDPDLLIADEPTTALDVTVQDEILELIADLRRRTQTALLLITHDLGVVAGQCSRALVMRDGQRLEYGPIEQIFDAPESDYTRTLLAAIPRVEG